MPDIDHNPAFTTLNNEGGKTQNGKSVKRIEES